MSNEIVMFCIYVLVAYPLHAVTVTYQHNCGPIFASWSLDVIYSGCPTSRYLKLFAFECISMGIGVVGLDSAVNYADTVWNTFVG